MGFTGPIPNRDSDLARPRERKGGNPTPVTKGLLRPVTIPPGDANWCNVATGIYDSLQNSGQSDFFQDSDWAYAWFICDEVARYRRAEKRSSVMLASLLSGLTGLLLTEGDRRRVRIELDAPEASSGPTEGDKAIQDAQAQLGLYLVPKDKTA